MTAGLKAKLKGVSPFLAAVLYTGIVMMAITTVVRIGTPLMENMRDTNAIDQAKDELATLDTYIREVASEGTGSVRVVPFEIQRGLLTVNGTTDQIYYELSTKSEFISARTRKKIGNIVFRSNAEVDVSSNSTNYFMSNGHLNVTFRKVTAPQALNTGQMIQQIYSKDTGEAFNSVISVQVNEDAATESGTIYTTVAQEGEDLGKGVVTAVVDSTTDYNITYTLDSGADFLTIVVND